MGGRKSPFPITLAIGLYNSLYYRTSRDDKSCGLRQMSVVFYCTANPRHYVNMAINRPSFMSSQFKSGYNYPASNGNDGDKTNCDGYGSIAHSLNEQNPWYAVDLGMALNVDFVNFTNRADCCGIVEHLSL